jgi:CubicO group peptidase (beta-lactamase class C family)
MFKPFALAVAAAAVFATGAVAETPAADAHRFDQMRKAVDFARMRAGVSGVSVAIAQNGKIVWEEGFGYADREKKVPADRDTLYSLASITKPITATALMTLVQQGKVDLDKPVNDYLGAAKLTAEVGDVNQATVRRVANHTSGLPMHYQFFYDGDGATLPPMDESIRRYGHLTAPPGERFEYSNFGFGVLDYVIERQSGQSYPDYVRDHVFLPLGMTRSVIGRPTGFGDNVATRYMPTGGVIPFYGFDHPGASAAYTSAHDLVRFGMFFLGDKLPEQKAILTPASIKEMIRPTSRASEKSQFGVAWVSEDMGGIQVVSHTGGMGGVSTGLYLIPDKDIVVVMLSNGSMDPDAIVPMAVKALGPDADAAKVYAAEAGLVGQWRGTVKTYNGVVPIELKIADGKTLARIGNSAFQDVYAQIDERGYLQVSDIKGDLGSPDAARYPYKVNLELKLRGAVLNGHAAATSDWLSDRLGSNLASFTELKKVSSGG